MALRKTNNRTKFSPYDSSKYDHMSKMPIYFVVTMDWVIVRNVGRFSKGHMTFIMCLDIVKLVVKLDDKVLTA